jgi:hypothetical protein
VTNTTIAINAAVGVTIITFTDGRIAEVVIDRSATAEHVLDAMDLVRIMIAHGVTAVHPNYSNRTKESPLSAVCDAT